MARGRLHADRVFLRIGNAWHTVGPALVLGLAPEGLKEYVVQRSRWALGFAQICRSELGPLRRGNGLEEIKAKTIYDELAEQPSIPAGDVLPTDRVFHRGTGEGWATDGDV